jgi:hypothetical protein
MKSLITAITILCFFPATLFAQDIYTTSGGEIILQSAIVEANQDDINTNVRFTLGLHLGEYVHLDLNDHVGFFTGFGLRNVGFITEENDIRVKYRTYNLGVPLALKAGSFKKDLYVFGGAEYEWMFQFKQKVFDGDNKIKYSSWFSKRTPTFIPSAFVGIQFPQGVQVKLRYYLDNYLNHKFDNGTVYGNYTGFTKTQVWYISLSFIVKNKKDKDKDKAPLQVAEL